MSPTETVRAIRGAITVERNERSAIVGATTKLLRAMLDKNEVEPADVVSIIFTATPDLTSEFPAAAARDLGLVEVPLLCAAEIAVPGALGQCIRVLLHVHTERRREALRHVYLEGARGLRTDLGE